MTVGYMKDVATATSFTFLRLLFRWRGSVWKAIRWELVLWLLLFVHIRTLYDFVLVDTEYGRIFESIVTRCRKIVGNSRTIITFALGFYVTFVTNRWWNVFMTIPWPDTTALQLTAFLRSRGKKYEDEDKNIRQTIMRYLCLSFVLVFRDVSLKVRNRFPTYDHLTPTLMTFEERTKMEKYIEMRHWVPIEWTLRIIKRSERNNCIDSLHYCEITKTILAYRQQLHDILAYDWISVPLVYVQAVNICTFSYFLILCFSSQTIYTNENSVEEFLETYMPFYSIIEFIVFNGWLKTAFVMLNPFGLDDDDFEIDELIERNLMVSLSYVTDFYDKPPNLVTMNVKLPHTFASADILKNANPMHGSAVKVENPGVHQRLLNERQEQIGQLLKESASVINFKESLVNPYNKDHLYDETIEKKDSSDRLKAPAGSVREVGLTREGDEFILKQEDLDKAVEKLLAKRRLEEMVSQRTQSMSILIDPTQLSEHSKTPDQTKEKKKHTSKPQLKLSKIGSPSPSKRKKHTPKASLSRLSTIMKEQGTSGTTTKKISSGPSSVVKKSAPSSIVEKTQRDDSKNML